MQLQQPCSTVPHVVIFPFSCVGSKRYGIAKNSNLIAVKALNSNGRGSTCGVIAAINWVTNQPRPNGAVINMSLGSSRVSPPLNDAVERAVAAGVHVVVSAGIRNSDACGQSPASAVNAITVGATGQDDAKAYFSNYGECLDIFAPGIESTTLRNGYYSINSGTSMAAHHVAGVAALLLQEYPTLTPAPLTDRMRADATAGVVTDEQSGSPNLLLNTEAINEPLFRVLLQLWLRPLRRPLMRSLLRLWLHRLHRPLIRPLLQLWLRPLRRLPRRALMLCILTPK
jgi:subtilisin family serine protease